MVQIVTMMQPLSVTRSLPLSLWAFLLAAILSIALVACGGDDDDGNAPPADDNGDATQDEPGDDGDDANEEDAAAGEVSDETGSDDNDAQPSGGGSGTLAVDGQSIAFDVPSCGFDEEATGNVDVPFSLVGYATDADGRELAVDATIVDLDDESIGEVHTISVYDTDSLAEVYYGGDLMGGGAEFELDGKNVSWEGEFWGDGGETSLGEGAFEATCP